MTRSIPHLRPLLATVPQYATWDDHDYGPNDAGREFWHKALATEIFTLFHGNPTAGLPEIPGIFTYFAHGDVHFYLLDNRTNRTVPGIDTRPFGDPPQQLGKAQIDWLVELMAYNRGQSRSSYPCTFHVVALGNQVFSPYSRDSLQHYPEEWQYLLDRIVNAGIHNVVFITGDVHFGEVSKYTYVGGGNPGVPGKAGIKGEPFTFVEVTSSPLTAGPWGGSPTGANPYRMDIFPGEADRVGQRNFATLTFSGPLIERTATIRYYDSQGNLLNQLPGGKAGETTPESILRVINPNLNPRLYP
jgi:alkaline phosphatase D